LASIYIIAAADAAAVALLDEKDISNATLPHSIANDAAFISWCGVLCLLEIWQPTEAYTG